jgi:hypothetical protein
MPAHLKKVVRHGMDMELVGRWNIRRFVVSLRDERLTEDRDKDECQK